jgi:hypothetical protein
MAWKTVDIHEQRVRFVVGAAQGAQPFSSLCAEFGSSRPTGYLLLRGYKELGVRGITEQSRRPLLSLVYSRMARLPTWLSRGDCSARTLIAEDRILRKAPHLKKPQGWATQVPRQRVT